MFGITGRIARRRYTKCRVKALGLTGEGLGKLVHSSAGGGCGIPGGAVKCVEIRKNVGGEGGILDGH